MVETLQLISLREDEDLRENLCQNAAFTSNTHWSDVSWIMVKVPTNLSLLATKSDTKEPRIENIFLAHKYDKRIPANHIAIPRAHRPAVWGRIFKVKVEVIPVHSLETVSTASTVTLYITNITDIKVQQQILHADLIQHITAAITGRPVFVGETYMIAVQGLLLKAQVVLIAHIKEGSVQIGLIQDNYTHLDFDLDPKLQPLLTELPPIALSTTRPYAHLTELMTQEMDFSQYGIGGLNQALTQIFRRAFISRMCDPVIWKKMGGKHVKDILLYGPPGTGKTLIARQIAKILKVENYKVVNGPEILNKYVGESEGNMRRLFDGASEDPNNICLVIFDEIDAICRARGMDSTSGQRDGLVNQLLSEMDGVKTHDRNILVIGMTNRKELLDPALLRPGRFEVQIEITLPDEAGRLAILQVHTLEMIKNNLLSPQVSLEQWAQRTVNYTGAELEGLVRSAQSYAMMAHVKQQQEESQNQEQKLIDTSPLVEEWHFEQAAKETPSAFGAAQESWQKYQWGGIVNCAVIPDHNPQPLMKWCNDLECKSPLRTMLLYGAHGTGCTAIAAFLAQNSRAACIKWLSCRNMTHLGESARAQLLRDAFHNAHQSQTSLIVVDDLEDWCDFISPQRFSSFLFQQLRQLCRLDPPPGRQCTIVCTTHAWSFFATYGWDDGVFLETHELSGITTQEQLQAVGEAYHLPENHPLYLTPTPTTIKHLVYTYGLSQK
jgi:vesicle-fusing ATPase